MSYTSEFLKMIIPLQGEYTDTWEGPLNDNLIIIDTWAKNQSSEILAARGNKANLSEFLLVGHNSDGTLKPTEEAMDARNSPVYGHRTVDAYYELKNRIDPIDWEIWKARELNSTLRDRLSERAFSDRYVMLSGGVDGDGQPTWLGFTNDTLNINANPEIKMLINGYKARIRIPDPGNPVVTVSVDTGSSTPKYLVAERLPDWKVIVDGDTTDGAPPVGATGTTSTDTSGDATIFYDDQVNFVDAGVQPGDVLRIMEGDSAGDYIIQEVGPEEYDGDPEQDNRVKIIGIFPVGGLSALDYKIYDVLGVDLEVVDSEPDQSTEPNKFVIADVLMATGPIRVGSVYPRHNNNVYIGAWRQVSDITSDDIDPDSESSGLWYHRLLSDKLEVEVQASQANDGSQPVEKLAVVSFKNTLAISVTDNKTIENTLGVDASGLDVDNSGLSVSNAGVTTAVGGTTDPHSHTMASNPSITGTSELTGSVSLTGTLALAGTITAAPTGVIYPSNAVKVQWNRRKIRVKNTISGVFYTDFDGAVQNSGYIRVIVRKRG